MRRQITSNCIKGSWSWDCAENASGLAPRIFTVNHPKELSGFGVTATWPLSVIRFIPKSLLKALTGTPHNMRNVINILTSLRRGLRQGGHRGSFRNRNVSVKFGVSGGSAAFLGFSIRSNTFSTTFGITSDFRPISTYTNPLDPVSQAFARFGHTLNSSQLSNFASNPDKVLSLL